MSSQQASFTKCIDSPNTFFFIENQTLTSYQYHQSETLHPLTTKHESPLLPTTGHTTHWIDNSLVSFFGKPNQPSVTIVDTKDSAPTISISISSSSPSKRYAHTTTLIRDNTTQLFLIGGSTIVDDQPQSDLWRLDWTLKTWTKLALKGNPFSSGIMGHVTLAIHRQQTSHLLTCFGANSHLNTFSQHCTLFNTKTLGWIRLTPVLPTLRIHSSLIQVNQTHAILYGGQSATSTLLGDLWWLRYDNFSESMITFTPLGHSIPRAGHTATMISDTLMLVSGGLHSEHDNTTTLDLATILYDNNQRYHKRRLTLRSPADEGTSSLGQQKQTGATTTNGISGGAIGGIVVGVLIIVGISVTLFVLYQRRQRRQRNYDLHSRAARFSLSTPPRPSESYIERRSIVIQPPEAAKTRLSRMSFGSEFGVGLASPGSRLSTASLPPPMKSKLPMPSANSSSTSNLPPPSINTNNINNHPNLLDSPSRQLYTNWVCETPVPPAITSDINNNISIDPRHTSMYINQSISPNSSGQDHDEDDSGDDNGKKRSSTAFKRLRLSIFKPLDITSSITEHHNHTSTSLASSLHQTKQPLSTSAPLSDTNKSALMDDHPTISNTKRRSSMFGLSKLLNLGESSDRPEQDPSHQVYHHHLKIDPRESIGSKSVASLQWVEFNNDMDFTGNLTPRQLAVMNHRQSCITLSSGSGTGYPDESSMTNISATSINRPTSPRNIMTMAQQLQQQHRYRLSQREIQSWDDNRLSRMITSPPHRLAVRDPSKTSSFPTLAPIHID